MNKLLTISAAFGALFASGAYAQTADQAKYFTIDENSIMITEVTDKGGTIPPGGPVMQPPPGGPTAPGAIPPPAALPQPPSGPVINPPIPGSPGGNDGGGGGFGFGNNIPTVVGNIDIIVNLAQKIWGIIEANAPVVNITVNYANAVPFGTNHWTQLQEWSKPATKRYEFSIKNNVGGQVVKVTYQVHYTYAGNYQGKGKFLTGVTIEPLSVQASWGYKVDLVAEVPDSTIANVGTQENPIASMQVKLKWKVHTAFKDITQEAIYYVQGDGFLQELGTPFKNGLEFKSQEKARELQTKIENSRFN
ncbi:MAG TPA: hypothetical protein DCL44_05170 [Elusimicrobia bacterium]|nr:hypothetical protein [Elusimicrobiota bacterium]